jgi:hypothetical protein
MITFLLNNKTLIIFTLFVAVLAYVDYRARQQVKEDFRVEELEDRVHTRERVEDAIQDTPTTVDDILEWLSKRTGE